MAARLQLIDLCLHIGRINGAVAIDVTNQQKAGVFAAAGVVVAAKHTGEQLNLIQKRVHSEFLGVTGKAAGNDHQRIMAGDKLRRIGRYGGNFTAAGSRQG